MQEALFLHLFIVAYIGDGDGKASRLIDFNCTHIQFNIFNYFSLVNKDNNTRSVIYHQLDKLRTRTITYGTNSIKSRAVEIWNFINKRFHKDNLYQKSKKVCKKILKKFFIDSY